MRTLLSLLPDELIVECSQVPDVELRQLEHETSALTTAALDQLSDDVSRLVLASTPRKTVQRKRVAMIASVSGRVWQADVMRPYRDR